MRVSAYADTLTFLEWSNRQGQLSEFVSYGNNSIHAALHLVCSLYSDINTKGVVMFWSYVQLDDGTQFAYSETRDDGTVRVAVERPVET